MNSCFSQSPIISFTEISTSLFEIHQAHAHMLKTGLFHNSFAASKLVAFATTHPDPKTLTYAHSVFTRLPDPNSYTYNAIIRAYANSPTPRNAFPIFEEMLNGHVPPDEYSFTFVLKACAGFNGIEEGKQLHGHVLKIGIESDVYIANTLIYVYAENGCFEIARKLLDKMPDRNVVSWNALLSAYVEKGLVEFARELFDEMEERNVESWNFMISGYFNGGFVKEAMEVFQEMPLSKNLITWMKMVTGCIKGSFFNEALSIFTDMTNSNVKPEDCDLVNLLSVCDHVGALKIGEQIHVYINKNVSILNDCLASALITMYSKCGRIDKALEVFRNTLWKDVNTWNSMISGLSIHGYEEDALRLYSDMVVDGFNPNELTFLNVLSACCRGGLLDEGRKVFDVMVGEYGIEPTVEHYGCMVNLLGGFGLMEEVEVLIKTMSVKEVSILLEFLLDEAYEKKGNVEVAKVVVRRLSEVVT